MNTRVMLVCVGALVLVLGVLRSRGDEQRRVVANLSETERHAVFANTIGAYRVLCSDRVSDAFQRYCETQRDFLRLFPDCDSSCVRLVAKVERGPTR